MFVGQEYIYLTSWHWRWNDTIVWRGALRFAATEKIRKNSPSRGYIEIQCRRNLEPTIDQARQSVLFWKRVNQEKEANGKCW